MNHFSRLLVGGGWNTPEPAPSSFSLTSYTAYQNARRAGTPGGLERLRGLDQAGGVSAGGEDGDAQAALILAYTSAWPLAWNQKASWTGPTADVGEFANPFGDQRRGLFYDRGGVGATFASSFSLAANQGVRLRLFLFGVSEPAEGAPPAPPDVFHARVGAIGAAPGEPSSRWQLTRRGGGWELARLTSTWSEGGQATLEALLDKEELSEAEQAQVDALRGPRVVEEGGNIAFPNAMFDIIEGVSLSAVRGVGASSGQYFDLTLLPEPAGRMNYRSGRGEWQSISVPDALAKKAHSTITGAGALELQTRAGAFIWQIGRPLFSRRNTLSMGPSFYSASYLSLLKTLLRADAATLNQTAQTGSTLLGTKASATWRDTTQNTAPGQEGTPGGENENTSRAVYFDLTLETTDNRFTPFLYAAQVDLHGGPRTLQPHGAWDSSEHLDRAGNPPVLEASYGQDGPMKRQAWTLLIRDPGGKVFERVPGAPLSALENRIATLSTGPSLAAQFPTLTRGLVQSATIGDLSGYDAELPRLLNLEHETSTVQLQLACAWALLDERKFSHRPVGDRQYLGAYLRRLLMDEGWSAGEVAGISARAGRILPRGALGEPDCIVPERGQSVGEYLRQLVERWGMGWELFQSREGVWTFAPRPSKVAVLGLWHPSGAQTLYPARFSSDAQRNSDLTFPGRFAVLKTLSAERDFSDFYNVIEVEGGLDPRTGLPLYDAWRDYESIENEDSPRWLGREKVLLVCDAGIRNRDDLLWVLHSLWMRHGQGGRTTTFETYFHQWAQVGHIITVDNVLHRIARIASASLARDRMSLAAQEL